ncbi:sensor histidine kinase [Geobacillus sp. MMMUD3]|nr:sensor histidine kinase [Geobacillus sp. MMMUD3]TWG31039.1 putative regulator of cell autolysis [Geobacillus sp. C56-T2]
MMAEPVFHIILIFSVLLPLVALTVLTLLGAVEKEVDYWQLEHARLRLEKELQESKYMQLHQQIRPHFFFNALNAFLSLARLGKNEEMIRGIEHFALFLRDSYETKQPLIPFKQEWEHTHNYLAVQQLRFGSRLSVAVQIDRDGLRALIPSYTLQTLVENAFKHGLEKKTGEKRLTIDCRRQGNWVYLRVCDNGHEGKELSVTEGGVGLDNLRKRFALLFDLPTQLVLQKNEHGWTEAAVVWPYVPSDEV